VRSKDQLASYQGSKISENEQDWSYFFAKFYLHALKAKKTVHLSDPRLLFLLDFHH
jgi:hypothetical protein